MYNLSEITALYNERFNNNQFNFGPESLYEPINQTMANSGKRIRPVLLLLACDLFKGNLNDALNAAFAIEIFHNFTLVHDDIMDAADKRRNKPTVFKQYGLNSAILVGDAMHLHAFNNLLKVPAFCFSEVMKTFSTAALEIIAGQQMDMDFEKRNDVTVNEYLKMIEYKTSVLLAAALKMGAIIGNANTQEQEKTYHFGLNLGLAFQIKDDYLDTFGEGEKVGKKIGGDILRNKKTYLWLTAWNQANESQKQTLENLLSETNETQKIDGVLSIFKELKIKEQTEKIIQHYYDLALHNLETITVKDERKTPLRNIALMLQQREY